MPIMICRGIPTTKMLSDGMERAKMPKLTFVRRMENVMGSAICTPVKKMPVVKRAISCANETSNCIPKSGIARKLSTKADRSK